jgi:hypothetical protein
MKRDGDYPFGPFLPYEKAEIGEGLVEESNVL